MVQAVFSAQLSVRPADKGHVWRPSARGDRRVPGRGRRIGSVDEPAAEFLGSAPLGVLRDLSWKYQLVLVLQGLLLAGFGLLLLSPIAGWDGFRDVVVANLTLAMPGVLLLARARSLAAASERRGSLR